MLRNVTGAFAMRSASAAPRCEVLLDLAYELVLGDDRSALVEEPWLDATSAPPGGFVCGAFEPCGSDPPLHRFRAAVREAMPPAGLVDQIALASGGDDQPGSWDLFANRGESHSIAIHGVAAE